MDTIAPADAAQSISEGPAAIPDQLFSEATIVYLGFNDEKASEIWDRWSNWPASPPRREIDPDDGDLEMTFFDWVTGFVNDWDVVWEDDDAAWLRCMQRWGIATELQNAIMDKRFESVRLSGTCAGWVLDTIEIRYAGLEAIHRDYNERERMNHHTNSGHSEMHPSRSCGQSIPTLSCSSEADASQNEAAMTVLYRATYQARTDRLFDSQGILNRISVLWSHASTDFSDHKAMNYFTPNFEVAKRNAAWVKSRANGGSAVIVRIAISNSIIESMAPGEVQRVFWPSPEWKELVWRCHTRKYLTEDFAKYDTASLIIGTVANKPSQYYYTYSSSDQLTDACVLDAREPAVQYAFSSDEDGQSLLSEQARRTIKLLSFTATDLEEWMTDSES
ncbi:hypothetical protein ACHAQK_004608 [Fusarium lateritium]